METSDRPDITTNEISITAKPILGLRYLNKRTRIDILNYQVYVPESPNSKYDSYNYKLDRIIPLDNLEDIQDYQDLQDISEFNRINPEVIITNPDSSVYTPKIRLIERTEYYDRLFPGINTSKLKPIDTGIDYHKFKFILGELKHQYNNAKRWHELVHIALEIPKIELQKIHLTEAQDLLESGYSIQNFISLPLLPKLQEYISNCIEYTNIVDEYINTIDINQSPLEMGNRLLQMGSELPFITDQYILLKNLWESHIDKTDQINSSIYRNDYLRVAMLTLDDFKLNIPYIKRIYNDVKIVIWMDQIKKMVLKTPRYTDAVKILSVNFNQNEINQNEDKLELESRCKSAKKWLEDLSKSPVSNLVIGGVRELVYDDSHRKGKPGKPEEESLKYFTIFKDDLITLNPDLIDENNPFYNQETLIQSLGGVESIISSHDTESELEKPHPKEVENFYTQLSGIKLAIWCSRFIEPITIKYRKFTRRFKRAIDKTMSKIEIVILLQDAHLLSQQLRMDEHIERLKLILFEANEYETKCKQILDTRHLAVSKYESERLIEPWISFDVYRKQDIIKINEIEYFIKNYIPISGVDISLIDDVITKFESQTIKNYPLMNELNDAKSIYVNWTEKMEQVLNEITLSNGDLNRSIILLLDARKHGINFNINPLILNLKCYILYNYLEGLIKTHDGQLDYMLKLLEELESDNRYIGKILSYMNQMQHLDDESTKRLKLCINNGIKHYIESINTG